MVGGLTGTVTSVKLRLRVTNPSSNGGSIYRVGAGWTEGGITWNNAPPISGSPVATIGATTDNTWKEIDLTGVVTGNGTYRLAISDGNSNLAKYASREATTSRARHHGRTVGMAAGDQVVNAASGLRGLRGHLARWGGLLVSAIVLSIVLQGVDLDDVVDIIASASVGPLARRSSWSVSRSA